MDGWPFFDLEIRTPRVTLRVPDDAVLEQLANLAVQGIHGPDRLPFDEPWSVAPPVELRRNLYQWAWRGRSDLTAEHWRVAFAVFESGQIVGTQDLVADRFSLLRTFGTGSWVGQSYQGKGIGKEMRAAVLHFGFAGLGALQATTGAWEDNVASQRVTESLGYERNGSTIEPRTRLVDGRPADQEAVRQIRYVLTQERWEAQRRDDIEFAGLEPCLPLLGLGASAWRVGSQPTMQLARYLVGFGVGLVAGSWPEEPAQPVTFGAGRDMHMHVRLALADLVVDGHERAARAKCTFHGGGDPADPLEQRAHCIADNIGQRTGVLVGNDQRVARKERPHI